MVSIVSYLRSFKLGPFAAFDFIASYLVMYLLASTFGLNTRKLMLSVIPLSLLIHWVLEIDTPLTKSIFRPQTSKDYMLLAVVIINDYFLYTR